MTREIKYKRIISSDHDLFYNKIDTKFSNRVRTMLSTPRHNPDGKSQTVFITKAGTKFIFMKVYWFMNVHL